ncbi:U3 small nucleolar RNA associated protein [Karstenula rhodostoma CBS 690.94]|uniref:U3 small nucleolar RNA associated protein n=1 Tax=Karstenula rhodostoma CBS 690.94 TaxID=1392251 RepID=A0A9P4UBT5_9PLEO|nr:U3 small nucleolar RNA associated protein [Karstenula rhodostoma CBS 690.94]
MKIRALSRPASSAQAPGSNVAKLTRNLDPTQHPFERAREYTRALTATKLERMFAQPFLGDFEPGHVDGVYSLAKDPESLEHLASGSGDGIVKVWDQSNREEKWQAQAHENMVKGMCWTRDRKLLTCGSDQKIQLFDPYTTPSRSPPKATWHGGAFTSIAHHRNLPNFAAASDKVSIYDISRASGAPVQTLNWPTAIDTINALAWNQVETSIVASAATDRAIILYDLRTSSPLHRTVLHLASNCIAWNPMEAFNFAVANEDHNIYAFDMRNMKRALNVYKGHVAAVMSVEYSPTGEGLVSGSYDRSVRLWERQKGHARDIYHTKRMQRVFSVAWSADNNYVLSGSDDGNVRLWRAKASSRQGVKSAALRQKLQYDESLKERYQHMPEVKRIARHRHVPKQVKKAGEIKTEELASVKRKEENERRHSKKGTVRRQAEREKMILAREQ